MNISNTLIKTTMITLDALIKASGTDIRLHGTEKVPDQPVLYVINHFTRMETILMPYIIKKNIKKYPISLADQSFFGGKMGDIMDKYGAISTVNPNRDAILINALLTDSNPVIIFPEGQMIKDKKIIEKGKYIAKAQDIINELNAVLDMEAGGEIATNLRQLYLFMVKQLSEANTQKDPRMIREVISLMEELNQGWKAITGS